MANYSVDIAIAVKGAKELKAVRKETSALSREINTLNKLANKQSKTLPNSFNTLNKALGKAKGNLNKVALGTERYFRAIGDVIDKEERLNKAYRKQKTDFKVIQRLKSKSLIINKQNIQLVRDELAAELKLARAKHRTANANKAKGKSGMAGGGRRGNFGNAIGSGIIGGGFPLLFGQGGTAAVGGAIGGLAGGALGGQFGFALSIAGTTIGAAVDDLALALTRPTENIKNLVEKLNLTNKPTGKLVLELEELGLTTTATNLVLDKFSQITGKTPEELRKTTDSLNTFKDDITKLGLQLTIFGAEVIGPIVASLNKIPYGQIKEKLRPVLDTILFGPGGAKAVNEELKNVEAKQNFPTDNSFAANRGLARSANSPAEISASIAKRQLNFNKEILPLKQALEIEQKRLTTSADKLNLMKMEFELTNTNNELRILESQVTDKVDENLSNKIQKLKIIRDTQKQVVDNTRALIDPTRKVTEMIAQDMGNAIKELIKGTKTLNDVMINMLNKMAEVALNQAIFGNISGSFQRGGGGILGSIFKANGGTVKGGNSYIVGERGPELFSPGVSGTITPNHAMGSSVNVSVNVDASGTSVEGDQPNGEELGRLIGAAVQAELIKEKRPGGLLG